MNVEATGRRCLTCGQPVRAHAEENVKEGRARNVQMHATGQAVRDERPPVVTGAPGRRGSSGEAVSDLHPDEWWLAEARQPLAKDRAGEVIEVGGARVQVRPWT